MSKKTIIRIGVGLLAIAFVSLAMTAMISVLEGVGGVPISYSRTGRPSIFIGVAYLPFFLITFIIGCIYSLHRLRKFFKARGEHRKKSKEL
ncbi:MAG: hypothetical protein IPI20_10600 [Rhodoferax sp.]|jgi:hypothetical protein|nr:hypothetical protein [Rhodoferax sp.]MBK7548240.1 hypothetical protein [Rhodoferax sp.]